MRERFQWIFGVLVFLFSAAIAQAGDEPTLTKVDGQVEIFSHPSQKPEGPPPHALFENQYYSVKKAAVGDKVEKGNIVRTAVDASAKLVYENGDHMVVGPATAYKVTWEDKPQSNQTVVRLLYGGLRSVISKSGPRNNLNVKTSDTVMGVRGTDFYVARRAAENKTEVTTLRGAVGVAHVEEKTDSKKPAETKPIEVKAGMSAVVSNVPEVAVAQTDRGKLEVIQKITTAAERAPAQGESPELAKKVDKLEHKAVQNTLQDIKVADPKLYAQLAKANVASSEQIDTQVVRKVAAEAPPAPPRQKPTESEFDDLRNDSYDRYFKKIE